MSGKDGPPATFTPSRNSKFIHERMMTTGQPPEGMRQRLDPQHGSLTTIGTAQLSSAQLSMIDFHKNPTWISFEDSNLNYGDGFAPYIRENPIATEGVESREFKVKLDFRDSIGKTPISSDHVLVQITGVTGHKPLPPDMTPRAEVITTFSDIRGDHSDFDENPKRTFDMGFASSIVLGSSAFVLGMIFVAQAVDIPLLYQPVTDQAIENAYTFYGIWWEAPGAIKALFHVALILPLVVLLGKLHRWSESAMFFDGSAIFLQSAIIILYLSIHVQSLRTFLPDSHTTTSFSILPTPPPRLTPATESEKVEAVRVLAAGNALVALLVLGVMGMQVGQEYARRLEEREQGEIDRRFAAQVQVAAGAGAEGKEKVESKKTK
ncbi:ER membrane protein SH3-domain-containing protein [Dioszegia hungarica]|uniref:ER membrane protein SH3-domain-containing protein n=1 Tax=Dioszegia hungarica TaxID=4972 RepID=A0AA38H360_9TREE|nr:ER membrane protein SH3-domain-containing protein [Dioszegia hungarica]KAI9633235.1 ER membrane protein SH3-domain-containing protein [Dioszegia hungarica]